MSNVPDDWDCYWLTCGACGKEYHASGTTTCGCEPCSGCEEFHPPDRMEGDACEGCIATCVWAWKDTSLEKELHVLLDAVSDGAQYIGGPTEMLHAIELLKASIEKVHRRLSDGYSPK